MPASNELIAQILDANPIQGIDYEEGLSRFGNQASIYLRIIGAFIKNTPASLEELAKVSEQGLNDYMVTVHGLKGSCYGISAIALGDEARAMEFASKAFDWEAVQRGNPTLLEHAQALIAQLEDVVGKIEQADESGADARPLLDGPDKALVKDLLYATLNFDVEAMEQLIVELDKARYTSDPKLVAGLREDFTNFRYDLIEEKTKSLLD